MIDTRDVAKFVQAIRGGDIASVRRMVQENRALLGATDEKCFGATPLIHAMGTGSREMVDLLLDLGADINQRSNWWAGGFGVLESGSEEMARFMLERGATLTPHGAARLGMIERLKEMLEREPGLVQSRGGDGQLPLHMAAAVEVAALLLEHGAEIDAKDIDHASTAAQWACERRPEVAGYLVSKGAEADPFMAVRIGDPELLERTLKAEPDGLAVRVARARFAVAPPAAGHIYLYTIGEGCGLLHAAAGADRGAIVRWLVEQGADVNQRGGYDHGTALHAAAWGDRVEAAEALVDCGADMNAVSGPMHHNEPIGWAIVGGSEGVVRMLLRRGAAVRPHHIEDSKRGVEGAFRQFNPERPLEAWGRIAEMLKR